MYARTCHETALWNGVRLTSAPTGAAPAMVREVANTTCKVVKVGIGASARGCVGTRVRRHAGASARGCVGTRVRGLAAAVTWAAWAPY